MHPGPESKWQALTPPPLSLPPAAASAAGHCPPWVSTRPAPAASTASSEVVEVGAAGAAGGAVRPFFGTTAGAPPQAKVSKGSKVALHQHLLVSE